jgi:hypothetical protein
MAYESRPLRRQKIRYNSANTDAPLKYQLVLNGAKQTPSAATITVYDPGGTSILSATAMTVSGTVCSYSVSTTTTATWPVDTGYRARISATVSGTAYADDIIFDVCKFLLLVDVAWDQLVALDDRVRGLEHNGDTDLSEVIEAARDELQLDLETKAIEQGRLLENMVLDKSRVSIPARLLTLAQIFESKSNYEAADRYRDRYERALKSVLAGVEIDANQDLQEEAAPQGLKGIRLKY